MKVNDKRRVKMIRMERLVLTGLLSLIIISGFLCVDLFADVGLPSDTPEQVTMRKALKGKGYIYVPQGNQLSRVNADGTDLRVLWKSDNARDKIELCQVSWDGLSVAFALLPQQANAPKRKEEMWLISYDGSNPKKILDRTFSSYMDKLYCAWLHDTDWLIVANGVQVDAVNRKTGKVKSVLEARGDKENRMAGITYLSADLQGSFYFWSQNIKGNAFSLDKDCNVTKEIFNCGMNTACQPRISPDGKLMARHDHDYEWNDGHKRGYVTERPVDGEKTSYRHHWLPGNEGIPFKGTHNNPFWSPDGAYIGFVYFPNVDLLEESGFKAKKKFAGVVVCGRDGKNMLWLTLGNASFPSWGPVPK